MDLKGTTRNIEFTIVGLCLKNKRVFENDFFNRVESKHFTTNLAHIYEALEILHKTVDIQEFDNTLVIQEVIKIEVREDQYNTHETSYWLGVLGEAVAIAGLPSNASRYAETMLGLYNSRIYTNKLSEATKLLQNGESVASVNDEITSLGAKINDENNTQYGKSPSELFEETLDKVLRLKGAPTGYLTGWKQFDEVLNGIENKTVLTIAGRPSMGKTAFGVQLAYNLAKNGTKTMFFSAEMDAHDLASRMIPLETRVGTKYNKDYEWLNKDKKRLELIRWGNARIEKLEILVDDHSGLTIEDIEWKLPKYVRDGYKVFIIDYVQFIGSRRNENKKEHEKITYVMKMLKTLAKKYDVAIVALAQIGRVYEQNANGKSSRPTLSDLKGSGSIEENSDKVVAIHRPWYFLKGLDSKTNLKKSCKIQEAKILILKNRNGGIDDITFKYFMDYNNFQEVSVAEIMKAEANDRELTPVIDYETYLEKTVKTMLRDRIQFMKNDKGQNNQQLGLVLDDNCSEKLDNERKISVSELFKGGE